jgi:hypothetical protein
MYPSKNTTEASTRKSDTKVILFSGIPCDSLRGILGSNIPYSAEAKADHTIAHEFNHICDLKIVRF